MKADLKDLITVIDKCSGPVVITTKEGDRFNAKSKLSQLFGLLKLIENAEITIEDIQAEKMEDRSRITRYFLYLEI